MDSRFLKLIRETPSLTLSTNKLRLIRTIKGISWITSRNFKSIIMTSHKPTVVSRALLLSEKAQRWIKTKWNFKSKSKCLIGRHLILKSNSTKYKRSSLIKWQRLTLRQMHLQLFREGVGRLARHSI